jgi:uncharacterized repeat protein (TIGR03803 family)
LGSGGNWTESVIYNFCSAKNCEDGAGPAGPVTFDSQGNLYGSTQEGGNGDGGYGSGHNGVVFELSPNGEAWNEIVLHNFCDAGIGVCPDGAQPTGPVTFDDAGNLYGTTAGKGAYGSSGGTIYELSPGASWTFTVVHSFRGGPKYVGGGSPRSGVVFDPQGNLYGTAIYGGKNLDGVLFRRSAKGDIAEFSFDGLGGNDPDTALIIDEKRNEIFGTAAGGGQGQEGVVYKIDGAGVETVLHNFCSEQNCTDGYIPRGVIKSNSGNLYGAVLGGTYGQGLVYEIGP